MDPVIWESKPPELRSPALICAFAGWNDAAERGNGGARGGGASLDPQVVAQIDPEEFYDFQVNRPTIRLVEGRAARSTGPRTRCSRSRCPRPSATWRCSAGWSQRALAHLRRGDRRRGQAPEVEMVITLAR